MINLRNKSVGKTFLLLKLKNLKRFFQKIDFIPLLFGVFQA